MADAVRALQGNFEVTVFGTTRPIDEKLVTPKGFELVRQQVRPMPSKLLQWPGFLRAWRRSLRYARHRFTARTPAAVLGLGGYAAGPPVVAAAKLGAPTAIFNPDAVPGRANLRLSTMTDRVFVQWEETKEHFPKARDVRVTGCPIRPEFATATRAEGRRHLGIPEEGPLLLITGASQGARSINLAALELCDLWKLAHEWKVVHVAGEADREMCEARYRAQSVPVKVIGYTDQMPLVMAASDLVVSRAGASTLAELTAMGLPSVLLPYPFDRKRHQLANARILAEAGAAEIVDDVNQPAANARRLRELLADLMRSEQRRKRMSQAASALGARHAAEEMAEQILELIRG